MNRPRRKPTFDRARCLACRACELACAVAHSTGKTLAAAVAEPVPPTRRLSLAQIGGQLHMLRCRQCREPLCVFSCKSGALQRDPGTGQVVLDEELCVGCWMCLMVCPDGVRPDPCGQRVLRCDVCLTREVSPCAAACPTGALQLSFDQRPLPVSGFDGHLVVVGSSAAGVAACESAREVAPAARVTLVTADVGVPYSRPMLAYLLARKISDEHVRWRSMSYLQEDLKVRVLAGVRADALLPASHELRLDDGTILQYDRLVVATGARPATLAVPGAKLNGVCGLRDLADIEAIEGLADPDLPVVVLGGGNVGLQVCEALMVRGRKVVVVARSPHLLSQAADMRAGQRVARLFASRGSVVRTGRDAMEILGSKQVCAVRLDDGEVLEAGLVVVAKGIRPNVEWLQGSGVRIGRGVAVDAQCRTNVRDVFAAGDCVESIDPVTGTAAVSGIWPVAYEMGWTAGRVAVGVERAHPGALRMNAARFFGVPMISIGEVRAERLNGAQEWVLVDHEEAYRKVVLRDGRLVGAMLFADISGAGLFYRLYREGKDLRRFVGNEPCESRFREAWYAGRAARGGA